MTFHRMGCSYPSDPCCCGAEERASLEYKAKHRDRLMDEVKVLKTQNAAMQALLERWVRGKDSVYLKKVRNETKTLLKEAKEVKKE